MVFAKTKDGAENLQIRACFVYWIQRIFAVPDQFFSVILHVYFLLLSLLKFSKGKLFLALEKKHTKNVFFLFWRRIISPDVLPSCSPGIFRQKSFRSTSSTLSAGVAATGNQCVRVQTPKRTTPTIASIATTGKALASNTGSSINALINKSIGISVNNNTQQQQQRLKSSNVCGGLVAPIGQTTRGPRTTKHSRLGTVLANKMASASTTAIVQGWPNTKDDYDLKEVIGKYTNNTILSNTRLVIFTIV